MRSLAAITLPLALLAACATPQPPARALAGLMGPEAAFVCGDQVTVYITEHAGDDARVVFADGKQVFLPQFRSTIGFEYGTAIYVFRGGGPSAVWTAPNRPPTACVPKQ